MPTVWFTSRSKLKSHEDRAATCDSFWEEQYANWRAIIESYEFCTGKSKHLLQASRNGVRLTHEHMYKTDIDPQTQKQTYGYQRWGGREEG